MTTNGDMGTGQSPVDITEWLTSQASAPKLTYASQANRVERTQGFVMFHFDRGSELLLDGERYRLLQLHWHTPAEHTVDGSEFAAEVHLVHIGADDQLLVVGAMYELGTADEVVQRLIDETTRSEADGTAPNLDAAELRPPQSDGFYHYTGSLTAAPFSEPVQWYVARTVRTVSQRQVEQLQSLTGGPNARALQERNERTIVCVGCTG